MNLRSVEEERKEERGISQVRFGYDDDDTRTLPVRRVDSYGLDLNQDFMITWHRDGHLLNQRSAILNSDRHQGLILREAGTMNLPVG